MTHSSRRYATHARANLNTNIFICPVSLICSNMTVAFLACLNTSPVTGWQREEHAHVSDKSSVFAGKLSSRWTAGNKLWTSSHLNMLWHGCVMGCESLVLEQFLNRRLKESYFIHKCCFNAPVVHFLKIKYSFYFLCVFLWPRLYWQLIISNTLQFNLSGYNAQILLPGDSYRNGELFIFSYLG